MLFLSWYSNRPVSVPLVHGINGVMCLALCLEFLKSRPVIFVTDFNKMGSIVSRSVHKTSLFIKNAPPPPPLLKNKQTWIALSVIRAVTEHKIKW